MRPLAYRASRLGIVAVTFAVVLCTLSTAQGYPVFLKNGQSFEVEEHVRERGLFIFRQKNGFEIGIGEDEMDMKRTQASYDGFLARQARTRADLERRAMLEEREKQNRVDVSKLFEYEKRGIQMLFSEDDAAQLIEFGDKNAARFDDIIKGYSFFQDYLPSVVYTKRLRLILAGVERSRTRRNIIPTEIQNIVQDPNLLLLVTITGDDPDYLQDAEVWIEQDGRRVAPYNFKVPPKGERTTSWPSTPAYYWRVLANFGYATIDMTKQARIVVQGKKLKREYTVDLPSYR